MQAILKTITRVNGVRGALVVGDDGLVIAVNFAGNEDPDTLGAVAASIRQSLGKALDRLQEGALHRFVMMGSTGAVVLYAVGSAILLTLVKKDANMGMVLVELSAVADELTAKLGG